MKIEAFTSMCVPVKGQLFSANDYRRIYRYIKKYPYQISFEDEEAATQARYYYVWKRKAFETGRFPMFGTSSAIAKKIESLPGYGPTLSHDHLNFL